MTDDDRERNEARMQVEMERDTRQRNHTTRWLQRVMKDHGCRKLDTNQIDALYSAVMEDHAVSEVQFQNKHHEIVTALRTALEGLLKAAKSHKWRVNSDEVDPFPVATDALEKLKAYKEGG